MKPNKLNDLIEFISAQTGYKSRRISLQTRIGEDLGVAGDDGVELLLKYSKQFNVDISGFNFEDYFGSEGLNPLDIIKLPLYLFGVRKLKTLTVEDLYKGIFKEKLEIN